MSVDTPRKMNTPAMVSLHYLVMLHICEKILPQVSLPHEVSRATLRETIAALSDESEGRDVNLNVLSTFMRSIAGGEDFDYAEASVAEFIEALQGWWIKYKSAEQPAPYVHQTVVKLLENLTPDRKSILGCNESGFVEVDSLFRVIAGESVSDVACRVMDNPFVGFSKNPNVRRDSYSISVDFELRDDSTMAPPGYPYPSVFELPMIAISGNPAKIGSLLKTAVSQVASYLEGEGFGSDASVIRIVIRKNDKELISIPVYVNTHDDRGDYVPMTAETLLMANKNPGEIYTIDFKKMRVINSDHSFVNKLCEGLADNEEYYFKAGHFQDELGV